MKKKTKETDKGITLIALAITIIVLIILAGISIATLTGDNGILLQTNKAKEETEIASEKEVIENSATQAMEKDRRGNITQDNLQDYLDKNAGKNKTEVGKESNEYIVKFTETNRTYYVSGDGEVESKYIDKTPGKLDGKGTQEDPYKIETIEDLVAFSIMSNGGNSNLGLESTNFENNYIVLTRDLNFNSVRSYNDENDKKYSEYLDVGEETIKNALTQEKYYGYLPASKNSNCEFKGTFDGQGHKIEGLYIKARNDAMRCALINSNKGTIKNLNIDVKIAEGNYGCAGIVVYNYGNIQNCNSYGKIEAINMYIGGIASYNYGVIEECTNRVYIKASGYIIGGIVGINENEIKRCANLSEILWDNNGSAGGFDMGGIVGENKENASIKECYNIGKISGIWQKCAGIAGQDDGGTVENCYNIANISSVWNAGGITGGSNEEKSQIKNCYNVGTIESASKGALTGTYPVKTANIKYSFSLTGSANVLGPGTIDSTCGFKTENELKSDEIIQLLNQENDKTIWKKDSNNINNGYPILYWQ